jgi:hypothetical protein
MPHYFNKHQPICAKIRALSGGFLVLSTRRVYLALPVLVCKVRAVLIRFVESKSNNGSARRDPESGVFDAQVLLGLGVLGLKAAAQRFPHIGGRSGVWQIQCEGKPSIASSVVRVPEFVHPGGGNQCIRLLAYTVSVCWFVSDGVNAVIVSVLDLMAYRPSAGMIGSQLTPPAGGLSPVWCLMRAASSRAPDNCIVHGTRSMSSYSPRPVRHCPLTSTGWMGSPRLVWMGMCGGMPVKKRGT